jgi:alanine racemase
MISTVSVNLGAVVRNAKALAAHVAPARLAAVVKANAYGHGLVDVARSISHHVARLCVYSLEEAVALRSADIKSAIHVLGPILEGDLETAHAADVQITLWDLDRYAARVATVARRRGRRFQVHAEVDTGAARLGIDVAHAPAALKHYAAAPEYELVGVFTLLARADDGDANFTLQQMTRFLDVTRDLDRRIERHAAATAAAIAWPQTRLDVVRCGIGLYGLWPGTRWKKRTRICGLGLEAALSWRTTIIALHDIEPGASVGYGRAWQAARHSRIATLATGYAGGIPVTAGNRADVLLHGQRVPIVGRVSMNMTLVDVTDLPNVALGDAVTLIGCDGVNEITAEELASACRTVSHEITARIPADIPRAYVP